jgi:hypothetical protein
VSYSWISASSKVLLRHISSPNDIFIGCRQLSGRHTDPRINAFAQVTNNIPGSCVELLLNLERVSGLGRPRICRKVSMSLMVRIKSPLIVYKGSANTTDMPEATAE